MPAPPTHQNWSTLPPDLITSIAQLLSIPDLLRFRTVCKSWLSSSSSTTPSSSSHFPWLLLMPTFSFFALPENKSYHLSKLAPSPPFTPLGACSCNGYLAVLLNNNNNNLDSFLFNPFTGSLTNLPSFSALISSSYIHKIAFSSSLTAVAVCGFYGEQLAFARPGDSAWTPLDTLSYEFDCKDIVYHEGKFFAVSNMEQIEAFDLSGTAPIVSTIWTDHHHVLDDADIGYPDDIYLVSSPTGLLKVRGVRCRKSGTILYFVVYRFTEENIGCSCWEEIEDLGEESLFVSRKKSLSLFAENVKEVKRNCIYFIPECRLYEDSVAGVQVFDMEVGVIKPFFPTKFGFDCEVSCPLLWFMPSLL